MYTKETFLDSSSPKLIYFYSPKCGYCQAFNPTWDDVCTDLVSYPIETVKIDCTDDMEKCKSYDIKGYPTVLLQKDNQVYEFRDKRDKISLLKFVESFK